MKPTHVRATLLRLVSVGCPSADRRVATGCRWRTDSIFMDVFILGAQLDGRFFIVISFRRRNAPRSSMKLSLRITVALFLGGERISGSTSWPLSGARP